MVKTNNVYPGSDLVRGIRPPFLEVRQSALEQYKRLTGVEADYVATDMIDNTLETNFYDTMLGQHTHNNSIWESPTAHTEQLKAFLNIGAVPPAPSPLKGVLAGSDTGTHETDRRWAAVVAETVAARGIMGDEAYYRQRYEREPWSRASIRDIAEGKEIRGMQESDVDPSGSGHFNTYYHRSLTTVQSRDEHREGRIPGRVVHDMTTRILQPGNTPAALSDPQVFFED